jgi:transposase
MLVDILWPVDLHLQINAIEEADNRLIIVACGLQEKAHCPDCQQMSARFHGRYQRHPADLPCGGYTIQLNLTVPRFFCDNEACSRRTFSATFPNILRPYARCTDRLTSQQRRVAFAVGGEAGCRLLNNMSMPVSADTLIRLVRSAPEPVVATPRVLGVDDWAKRKGQSYGTILVDLEKQVVVDLLDERSPESFSDWLEEHPGVEIITRDRGADYKEGATKGAPEAVQIADRFHLLQNVADTLKRMLAQRTNKLRQAARQVAAEQEKAVNRTPKLDMMAAVAEEAIQETQSPPTLRQLYFTEVKEYQRQGWSQRAVAAHLNLDRRTVSKYFALESCPERPSVPQSTPKVMPHLAYLSQRWQEGCHSIKQLHAELEGQGFTGHYTTVCRAVKRLLTNGKIALPAPQLSVPVPKLSVTQAVWLLLHPDERLEERDCQLRDKLCEICQEIEISRQLAQSFCELVRERAAEKLDDWLKRAKESGIAAFKNFAIGLQRDYDVVKAALAYEWSNGQVEGQVNRLKFIKRQMYGRAKFDLLRKRVLGMPATA